MGVRQEENKAEEKKMTNLKTIADKTQTVKASIPALGDWDQPYVLKSWLASRHLFEGRDLTKTSDEDCACPGCGCLPGEGITESCNHEEGCGFHKIQRAL